MIGKIEDGKFKRYDAGSGSTNIDTELSLESSNPVENRVITEKINEIDEQISTNASNIAEHTANKSNPHGVTAEQVGAIPSTFPIVATVKDIVKSGIYYCSGCTETPEPFGYIEVFVFPKDTNFRRLTYVKSTNTNAIPYSCMTVDGVNWSDWTTSFLPLTGGPLKGTLAFENTDSFYALTKKRIISDVEYLIDLGVSASGSAIIEHYTDGIMDARLGLGNMKTNKATGFSVSDGTSWYTIFGTHNKPKGSYTGNGDATERTIDIGGIGGTLRITNGESMAIVFSFGAVVFNNTGCTFLNNNTAHYRDGILTFATTNLCLNGTNSTIGYQVL